MIPSLNSNPYQIIKWLLPNLDSHYLWGRPLWSQPELLLAPNSILHVQSFIISACHFFHDLVQFSFTKAYSCMTEYYTKISFKERNLSTLIPFFWSKNNRPCIMFESFWLLSLFLIWSQWILQLFLTMLSSNSLQLEPGKTSTSRLLSLSTLNSLQSFCLWG